MNHNNKNSNSNNNNMPGVTPIGPVFHGHSSRRQNDYHYSPQHQPPQHMSYAAYHTPQQFHAPPPHPHYYPQHYYVPYQPYTSSHSSQQPRPYYQHSPLIVSSHPNAHPVVPVSCQSAQVPRSTRTPQQEQSTTSTNNSQPIVSPSSTPTTTSAHTSTPPVTAPKLPPVALPSLTPPQRTLFPPQLPWYSVPASTFPPRAPRRRRKKTAQSNRDSPGVASKASEQTSEDLKIPKGGAAFEAKAPGHERPFSSVNPANEGEVPPASEQDERLTQLAHEAPNGLPRTAHSRAPAKPVVPIVPITPLKPQTVGPSGTKQPSMTTKSEDSKNEIVEPVLEDTISQTPADVFVQRKAPPKSWAELLRSKGPPSNGAPTVATTSAALNSGAIQAPKNRSLSEALRGYDVEITGKVSFLEPRGLVNTGNMCYMNSILQVLVSCVPFFEFLDQVGKRAVHSFKSDTPLIEAMISFVREFSIIDSAASAEELRLRLKEHELEQKGEPFTPEYVYDVIRHLPRFSSMRVSYIPILESPRLTEFEQRGHQQDAEEFLGFLLEGLHEECVQVMHKAQADMASSNIPNSTPTANEPSKDPTASAGNGWLEVGPKQKPSVTRSSGGVVTESPITKIFGGKLRSEFRVPGLTNSVTQEPYQPLQLDIGDVSVKNITDALKGLTRPEKIQGDFNSPRGPGATATKQVFIETLPPVLIIHLKRFQYDTSSAGGLGSTQKIWKRVGYPLELEIPREVLPQSRRSQLANRPQGLPRYQLIGVVYHHGKNASGGHYTVDVRRQDGLDWIRLDDTAIGRVHTDEVAREGSEEDPKVLAAALESHRRERSQNASGERSGNNIYDQAGLDDVSDNNGEHGWSQVNGSVANPSSNTHAAAPSNATSKKWSGIVNGKATPSGQRTPNSTSSRANNSSSVKDSKVAYILFYQQIRQ
ncbi:MAG: Ubiquitin carboxyl-terminal hydrolase 10 [Alyxoria varia]|nr:MAG: Ubiquitin carboxyl-terminal hydrolase 10 [Alyxoria varia]